MDHMINVVAEYRYDAWGNITELVDYTKEKVLGSLNPFRYRGYCYDEESGLYYLQTRYYDAVTGRFINADGFASTRQGVLGNNMFAYCGNNPISREDSSGQVYNPNKIGSYGIELLLGKVPFEKAEPYKELDAPSNKKLANAKALDRGTKIQGAFNCYGNAIEKEIVAQPTGYTKGDSTEKTFKAVVNDIRARNVRQLNSVNEEIGSLKRIGGRNEEDKYSCFNYVIDSYFMGM